MSTLEERLMKTQRFLAFVTAILITFFLAWGVFAREPVGVPPDAAHAAGTAVL